MHYLSHFLGIQEKAYGMVGICMLLFDYSVILLYQAIQSSNTNQA